MVITLDSELDNALRELAHRQGVAPETLVLNALRQQFLAAAALQPRDEWERGLLAAARDSAGTRRLVTVDAVGPTSAWMPLVHRTALERVSPDSRETLRELYGEPLHAPDPAVHAAHARAVYSAWFADPSFATYFTPPDDASETGAAIAARLRRLGYDWRDQLRALTVPVLVLHGERDALPPSVALDLAGVLPRARHTVIPDAGHMPFWEAPVPFFAAVESFLTARSVFSKDT